MNEAPAAHDDWSPLSIGEWVVVFIAGFCAMVLFFFRFYAGVFAAEIYEERNLTVPLLTLWTLRGILPLGAGALSAAAVAASLFPPLVRQPRARLGVLSVGLAVGLLGLFATLWGLYGPLMQNPAGP